MFTGFVIGISSCVVLALAVFVVRRKIKDESGESAGLELKTKRLQDAISELMARANDLDQDSKYLGENFKPEWSRRLAKACEDLVVLGDAVNLIETRLSRHEVDSAKDDLLISLAAANKINREITEIRAEIREKRLPG